MLDTPTTPHTGQDSISILVVDDEKFHQLAIKALISKFGYNVKTVSSGTEAINICKSESPNLILLDINMPDINGIETCKQLHRQKNLLYTPIIMLTGKKDSNSIQESYKAGAADYLIKPVNETILKQRIEYALYSTDILQRLITNEEELLETQCIAHIGSFRLYPESEQIYISSNCDNFLGIIADDSKSSLESFKQHIHSDDRTHYTQTLETAFINKSDLTIEFRYIYNDQEYILLQQGHYNENDIHKKHYKGTIQDVTHDRKIMDSLQYSRYYDQLTGLTNRAYFETKVQQILNKPPEDSLFMVAFIGIDNFSSINDELGHKGGDDVLVEIAKRLKEFENNKNIVSRFSGDIFCILIRELKHIDKCDNYLDNILDCIRQPLSIKNNNFYITASIGASVFPLESDNLNQLQIGAESAMMLASEHGGNQFIYRTRCMNIETRKRLNLLKDLRIAIKDKQFVVYYQAQVNAQTLKIIGMEALVRWIHPEHGLIPPDEFIPIAEDSGLIDDIDNYVLQSACKQNKKWIDMGHDLVISVNVSASQFNNDDFIPLLNCIINETKLPRNHLEIEVTESMAMKDHQNTIKILNNLRSAGISTSIDDFGTGYSSLSQLQLLPLDTLKVDQSFVKRIKKNVKDKSTSYRNSEIANAVIAMSHSLGLKVIAEGVENMEQCEFLQNQNSELLQGYLFSKPLPASEFEKLLESQKINGIPIWEFSKKKHH